MRLLLLTTRYPLPAWRGQQVRTIEWLAALADHDIVCVCPEPRPESASGPPAKSHRFATYRDPDAGRVAAVVGGAAFGAKPVQEAMYATTAAKKAFREALRSHRPDIVIIQMVRCAWAADILGREATRTPIVFDAIDAMGLHYGRAAETRSRFIRPFAAVEARRCRRRERRLAARAAVTAAVSERDVEALAVPSGRGWTIPVSGRSLPIARDPAPEPTIVFTGNLGYRPAVEAIKWFAAEVWPKLTAATPGVRWVLVGARPPRSVLALNGQAGIEIRGDVPDLAPHLAAAWVAIAPMASGSGVPMKVLEAWSAGVPVVAHPWTAAGLDGMGRTAVRQAETPSEWVEALTMLLGSAGARRTLAVHGHEAWERRYHPLRVSERIREAVEAAGRSLRPRRDR